nr:OsmC family protein [Anaerolineae bacterium]
MLFTGTGYPAADSAVVYMDASDEFGGQGKGMRPQSLMLVSLGGCTGMDVISILRKKRQDVTGLAITIQGEKAEEHPKVYTRIAIHFEVTGHEVKPDAVERAIDLSINSYCPVAGLLKQVVPIETTYTIVEA